MKSLYTCALLVMLSAIILAYTSINERKTVHDYSPAAIENLSFNVTGKGEQFRVVTADFDLVSGRETNGEIRIIVEGQQMAANRLIVKKGDAHYSVDFLMNSRVAGENQRLCSATANLIIKGETKDVKQKEFVLSPSLAEGGTRSQER